CPRGDHPWIVSAFNADGSLKSAWMNRLNQVITAADQNGIVVMVPFFYHGQNQRVLDQTAAVDNITDWLVKGRFPNVLAETANECDAGFSDYLDGGNCANEVSVIKQVQDRSGGTLKVSVSWKGGEQPSDEVIQQEDLGGGRRLLGLSRHRNQQLPGRLPAAPGELGDQHRREKGLLRQRPALRPGRQPRIVNLAVEPGSDRRGRQAASLNLADCRLLAAHRRTVATHRSPSPAWRGTTK